MLAYFIKGLFMKTTSSGPQVRLRPAYSQITLGELCTKAYQVTPMSHSHLAAAHGRLVLDTFGP